MTSRKIIWAVTAVLIVLVSWGIYRDRDIGNKEEPRMPSSSVGTTTSAHAATPDKGVKVTIPQIDYGYSVKATSTPSSRKVSISAPSLDYPIVVPADFSPADKASALKNLTDITAEIKKSPKNGALWAQLGFSRKGINDFTGSRDALEYALALQPQNAVVADNLGVVYGDYLKQPQKAEKSFLTALSLEPKAVYRYLRLFEFYSYTTKDSAKAKAILEQGLKEVPGDASLQATLESLK